MADGAKIAQVAREQSPNPGAFGECSRCDKRGLPVLPLRFAYVHKDTEYRKYQVNERAAGFILDGGELALRMLHQGYLYVLDERNEGTWRAFHVGDDGGLWEFPAKTDPVSAGFQCGRSDHLVHACTFAIPKPEEAKRLWMAYSSTRYTPDQLDGFKTALLGDQPGPQRDRFQLFHVSTLMTMENSGDLAQSQARMIDRDGAVFSGLVPEFDGAHLRFDESSVPGRDLRGLGKQVAARMHAMCADGGVAVFLDDPVGIALEARHYARKTRLELAELERRHAREIKVSTLVEQLRKAWGKGDFRKRAEWLEDYQDKLSPELLEKFDTEYVKPRRLLDGRQEFYAMDTRDCLTRFSFETACKVDFDTANPASVKDFASQIGTILAGLNLTESERKLAQDLLDKPVSENLWYRVMLADQKDLLEYLAQDAQANLADSFKSLYGAVDEWAKSYRELAAALHAGAMATPLQRAPGAATELAQMDRIFRATLPLAESVRLMTLSLQGLLTDAKLAAYTNLRIFTISGALWYNVVAVPFVETPTYAELLRDNKEAVWGHTLEQRLRVTVDADGRKIRTANVGDYTDELGEAAKKRIPLLRIHVVGDAVEVDSLTGDQARKISRQQRRAERRVAQRAERKRAALPKRTRFVEAMDDAMNELRAELAEQTQRIQVQQRMQAEQARIQRARQVYAQRVGMADKAVVPTALAGLPLAPEGMGWGGRAMSVMRNGGAYGGIATIVGAFQAVALTASWKEMQKSADLEAIAKVTSSLVGLIGASAEVTAAGMELAKWSAQRTATGISAATRVSAATRIAGIGGAIGGVAGVIGGAVTMWDGYAVAADGDMDSGAYTMAGGLVFMLGGAASVFGGLSLAGGGALLLGLGPGGWAVLAVGAALLGIALLFAADGARDNPLQNWMRYSCLGKDSKYRTAEEENADFEAIFKIPLEVRMQWRQGASILGYRMGGTVVVGVDAPRISDDSWVEYTLTLEMDDGRRLTVSENRSAGSSPGVGLSDPSLLALGTPGRNKGISGPTTGGVLGHTDKGGALWQFVYNEGALRKVGVLLTYWPNRRTNPELVVPSVSGLREQITEADAK